MARIRTIKPDFWTDEKLVECSLSARLLFIGLLNFADDNGNLTRSPKKIKMQIFPADAIDCEPLIIELITQGVLIEYSVSDEKYLHIKGFAKHQVINRPSKSPIPEPDFINTHGVLTDGRERKGKEIEIGKERSGEEQIQFTEIIKAFDDCRAEVFGEGNRRPYPRADDSVYAMRYAAAGYAAADCKALFSEKLAAFKAAGKQPISGLKYFENALAEFHRNKRESNKTPYPQKPPERRKIRGRSTKDADYLQSLEEQENGF